MLIDLSCPIENQGIVVKTNSETKEPYLLLKLFNLSEKKITEVSFRVLAYDANGTELAVIPMEFTELSAEPKSYFAENKAVSLVGAEEAKHFVVQVEKAVFDDETEYVLSDENIVEVDEKNATIDDALVLREIAEEAVCFASEHETYWRCVCGRCNTPDATECARCARNKDEVLKLTTIENVRAVLEEKQAAEELKKAEEAKKLEEEKALKIAKAKKIAIIAVIVIVAAAVLCTAGYFIYKAILNKNAETAMQNGDYTKAYELYQKTGSNKIGELTEYVQGNTPENLMFQSGFAAKDEDSIYYLSMNEKTGIFSLNRENKATKDVEILNDNVGLMLNVTKDWVYYLDSTKGNIVRLSKNDKTTEEFTDFPVDYMYVVGSDVYYIKTDFDNPNNLSEEQCQILAAQGQMESFSRLYRMNVDTREATLLSEDEIHTCYIYNDRIYYLFDKSEGVWDKNNLYSMDLNGEDKQVVIDKPVQNFFLRDKTLYYIEMYDESTAGTEQPTESFTLKTLNLENGETSTLAQDYMVMYMNASDDKIIFIGFDRATYFASMNDQSLSISLAVYTMDFGGSTPSILVAGEVSMFNVVDDEVVMFIANQGMCRVKMDGTGFKEIVDPGDEVVVTEEAATEEAPAESTETKE